MDRAEFARLLEAYASSSYRLPSGEANAIRDAILAAYDAARNEALEEAEQAVDGIGTATDGDMWDHGWEACKEEAIDVIRTLKVPHD